MNDAVCERMQNRDRALMLVVGALAGAIAAWLATSREPTPAPAEAAEVAEERPTDTPQAEPETDREPLTTRTRRVGPRSGDGSADAVVIDAELTTADGESMRVHVVGQKRLTRILTLKNADEMWVTEHPGAGRIRQPAWKPGALELAYRTDSGVVHWTRQGYSTIDGKATELAWFEGALLLVNSEGLRRYTGETLEPFGPEEQGITELVATSEALWYRLDEDIRKWSAGETSTVVEGGRSPAPGPELAWIEGFTLMTESGARTAVGDRPMRPAWLSTGELSWQLDRVDRADLVVEGEVVYEGIGGLSHHGHAGGWVVVPSTDRSALVFLDDDTRVELRMSEGSRATDPALQRHEGRFHVAYADGSKLVVLDVTTALSP